MARVFAVRVQILRECRRGRGTNSRVTGNESWCRKFDRRHLRSVAVQICLGAGNKSRCRIFIAGRCANPGLTNTSICLTSSNKSKNRDKQLTFIVRVSG
jgi:hypothetical protein